MKKYLLSTVMFFAFALALSAQTKVKYVSSSSSKMDLSTLADNNVNTVITRHFMAGYNSLCLPFTLSGEELQTMAPGLRVERLAAIGQEGATLCLYFVDCTNDGIVAGMPYLVYSPTSQTVRAKSINASDVSENPITVRMNDKDGNAVVFGSSWQSITQVGRYGIPAKQDVTPLESVLVRTSGDKTFLPTRCGFVWEQQSSTAKHIEIRHAGEIGDVTAIQALGLGNADVDVYDVKGMVVKKQASSVNPLEGLPRGIYVVGGVKVVK